MEEIKTAEAKKESMLSGLMAFLREYAIIGMAIGVIIAQTTKDMVDAIVKGIFTPLIDLLIPGERMGNLLFTIKGSVFDIGGILNSAITFLIVMTMLYVVVKRLLGRDDILAKK